MSHYKAIIFYTAYVDDYEQGQEFECVNSWDDTIIADTKEELKAKILEATYTPSWDLVDDDQMNGYEHAYEYHTSYLADEENEGDATEEQIEEWKQGKLKLYAINCQVLVTEVTESKAILWEY